MTASIAPASSTPLIDSLTPRKRRPSDKTSPPGRLPPSSRPRWATESEIRRTHDSDRTTSTKSNGSGYGGLHDSKLEMHANENIPEVNQDGIALGWSEMIASTTPQQPVPERLPPVALLLTLAYQVQIEASDILHFCALPPDILNKAILDDPALSTLDLPDPSNPTPTDIQNVYAHRMMMALTLLETAWHQTEERMTDKQRVAVGIEIGKVGIEVLRGYVCAKDERAKARKTKETMSIRKEMDHGEPSIAIHRTRRRSSETRSASPEKKKLKVSREPDDDVTVSKMIKKTSSIRPDFQTDSGIKEIKAPRRKSDLAAKWEKNMLEAEAKREKEGQRVLQGVEQVISTSLTLAQKLCSNSRLESSAASLMKSQMYELVMQNATLDCMQSSQIYALNTIKHAIGEVRNDETQSIVFYRMMLLLASWQSEGKTIDLEAAYNTLQNLADIAEAREDHKVASLALVERCRVMMATSSFDLVDMALEELGEVLDIDESWRPSKEDKTLDKGTSLTDKTSSKESTIEPLDLTKVDVFDANMLVHYLVLRIIWESRCGRAAMASALLKELHQLFDQGALDDANCRGGMLEVPVAPKKFQASTNFSVRITPPSVLFANTYLISCVAKPDTMGRRPRRLVYGETALESLTHFMEHGPWDISYGLGHGLKEAREAHDVMAMIKADLLVDLANLAICRVDMIGADVLLATLLDHLQANHLFANFAPKVLLLHAQRQHTLGRTPQAADAYAACRFISNAGSEIDTVARLGMFSLDLASAAQDDIARFKVEAKELRYEVAAFCSVNLDIALSIVAAGTDDRISSAKEHLGYAIERALHANNHQSKAIALTLGAAEFADTSTKKATEMLKSSLDIVRSIALRAENGSEQIGHPRMGAYLSSQLERLYGRRGEIQLARRQRQLLEAHQQAIAVQNKLP